MDQHTSYNLYREAHATMLQLGERILLAIELDEELGRLRRIYRKACQRSHRRSAKFHEKYGR